jgi:hypothetical protein
VLLGRCQRQNWDRFSGPKIAACQFAPEKTRSGTVVSSARALNARPIPVKRAIAFRSDRNVLIQENRSLFDVDFTTGDGILRFARMDCSNLWVPGHGGDVMRRRPLRSRPLSAGACRNGAARHEHLLREADQPDGERAAGARKLSKECTGCVRIFRHCAPCSLECAPRFRSY